MATNWQPSELETLSMCPICGLSNAKLLYCDQTDITFGSTGKWNLWQCKNCTGAYLNPRPTSESIGKAYQSYYTHATRRDWLLGLPKGLREFMVNLRNGFYQQRFGYALEPSPWAWLVPVIPWLEYRFELDIRQIPAPPLGGKLLDLGCGNGDYLATMRQLDWDVYGIEPDPKAAQIGLDRGLQIHIGTLEDSQYSQNYFDVITLSHVIEHLHDPISTLHRVWQLLKPGGQVWIATPNLESFGHQRYRSSWRGLEIPRHLVLFSTKGLVAALKTAGFETQVPNRQALVARNLFRVSNSLAQGSGIDQTPRLPFFDILLAIYADLYSIVLPWRGEYASVFGRKP